MTTPVQAQENCQPFNFSQTERAAPAATSPAVELALTAGLLQPQIETLLKQHFAIRQLDWRASPHYRWSTDFTLTAASWEAALERVLQPYQLQLTLYANHTAVVSPAAVTSAAGSKP
ncbi:hypothetical protein J6I75_03850 [Pseudidiomarina sp. 1APP75-27a]|uniref:hypothetical protein n=1 Tax=Pseudidiomarina terrestris TaxID=2820060 RepID=UPI002654BF11|nr:MULTISPECIES: hypothetical protein [unclassified Pseudidiomarina]MDN7127896.1 hypothetical protein [Pseudidiomarina sp. 1APR75-33.1]MDN7137412.1 hypothetical protein [Pseudidiomarina sp. 1ASP75-14]MEA3587478.1 hypothetical protein [Pseudidiomarina sp. 1APP75-27a]